VASAPSSATATATAADRLPRHVAIIMDGNGRWAERRRRPRSFGHRAGVKAVRASVEFCLRQRIPALTLFAFSSENWSRPATEVNALMTLFLKALDREVGQLREHGVRLRFIGDPAPFPPDVQARMRAAEESTAHNAALALTVAANYGGRWDLTQACRTIAAQVAAGEVAADAVDADAIAARLSLAGLPEPDLFIRTGGDHRISNFLLWQLAYTELHFTDVLWPDFDAAAMARAIEDYARRERRFGRTGAQLRASGTSTGPGADQAAADG
jgi:undecaprenyl diphosphate synthase